MLFNSLSFLICFPITVAIYYALPFGARWMFLLVASVAFYMAFVPSFILILLVLIVLDYSAGLLIERLRGRWRAALLAASIVANVGLLSAFKYFGFVNDNLAVLADQFHAAYPHARIAGWYADHLRALAGLFGSGYPVQLSGIILPLGLSFHTFQSMAYTIEVYRRRQRAERNFGVYALYVLYFPQLVAGPIERPQNLIHQLRRPVRFNLDRVSSGYRLMLLGFVKKVVIADRAAAIVDPIYNHPTAHAPGYLVVATYLFALQIYCDFSGYTDIARGASRVMGIRLMRNFDRPYAAQSVAEFWRRWHISLSTWFRDYVYFPLGGSRHGVGPWVASVAVVFLLSGLWHGASWTFVAWAAIHATYLIVDRITEPLRARLRLKGFIGGVVRVAITFHLVAFAWIFFRAASLHDAIEIVRQIGRGLTGSVAWLGERPYAKFEPKLVVTLWAILEIAQWTWRRPQGGRLSRLPAWYRAQPAVVRWPVDFAAVATILLVGNLGAKSFIYFQF
jgi:D-alanyl-lipoteichoic acid acyltransferase DltB (MBOAT superfamily)